MNILLWSEVAQLRYFLIAPEYRSIGLGAKLMTLFMVFLQHFSYQGCYLWPPHELEAATALYKCFGFKLTEKK